MKKLGLLLLSSLFVLSACSGGGSDKKDDKALKVGMVTDSGTIDDQSFNQGTWEGILRAEKELGVSIKYLQPEGETKTDYLAKIKDLYDGGYKMIITPGYKFIDAITEAQTKYPDAQFVLIDGEPTTPADNTQAVYFAEYEAGFMAAVATAIEKPDAVVGFIGGMEIPAVQKFNWGFQQGIKYANKELGTKVSMSQENFVYQGTFNSAPGGQQIAAQMYDRGVTVIFHAAGGTGVGVISEAKERASKGKDAWVVGVDSDQFEAGKYDGDKSVILTSALKRVDVAAFDAIKAQQDGSFKGGVINLSAKDNAVGIPEKNPNLSDATYKKAMEVYEKLKAGTIKVDGPDSTGAKPASADFK